MSKQLRIRMMQGVACIFGLSSLGLFLFRPDVEQILDEYAPTRHMPDAFRGLNGILAIFFLFVALTQLFLVRIEKQGQFVWLFPLLFGPGVCFVGWCCTENFDDPSWFHLFALITLGMLVSCAVTALLWRFTKSMGKQTVPSSNVGPLVDERTSSRRKN